MGVEPTRAGERSYSLLTVLLFAFFSARLVTLVTVPYEGLTAYSDLLHFYNLAQITGWPFLNYWVEYPPVFPFLAKLLYLLTGGARENFSYLLMFLFTLADAGSLALFYRIAVRIHPSESLLARSLAYLFILVALPYCLWYFDPLVVFLMLLGIWLLIQEREEWAVLVIGLGILTKTFPALLLVWIWRRYPLKRAVGLTLLALALPALVYGLLWAVSPDFTLASLVSQGAKGSWETVWALIDGNYQTGLFGPLWERLDPALAWVSHTRPAVISPYLTLLVFGGLGFAGFLRARRAGPLALISLVGFAWAMLMLWSRGWSVQWVLYILPLVLLVLPDRSAVLLSVLLILDNVLEYPVAFSRGQVNILLLTILLRAALFGLLAVSFYRQARGDRIAL